LPSSFKILLEKEIKEILRDPKVVVGMILMPILMFGVMGFAMNISFTAMREAALKPRVAVLDLDGGVMAQTLISLLQSNPNASITVFSSMSLQDALLEIQEKDFPVLIVIPNGFSENVTMGRQAKVELYTVFRSLSFAEAGTSSTPTALVEFLKDQLVVETIREAFPNRDPDAVLNPIIADQKSVIKGNVYNVSPQAVIGVINSQAMTMPMTIMMLLVFAMQLAATSVAIEKEEKTLETLLTLPVNRLTILASKLAGSVVVAAIGSSIYMVGYTYYIGSFTSLPEFSSLPGSEALGLTLTPLGFALLGLSLFISLISALALAVTVSALTEDVRSAQTLVSYLFFLIFAPSFIQMFIDVRSLPFHIQLLLYVIPYTHPTLAAKAAILEDYWTIIYGIIYMSIFTFVVLYVAARLFTTEKLLTTKISFKKFKFRK